jgi:putative DNA primase/helicase
VGNGKRLAQWHGDKIRSVAGLGWYVWNGVRWSPDETHEVERLAKEICRNMLGESAQLEDSRQCKALATHALASESVFRLKAMIQLAASELNIAIRAGDLDSDPWLFNVTNGVLDLRTGNLLPHQPEHLISKLAPVTFAPAAVCPVFDQFMGRIFAGDTALIEYVRRVLGMCLTGDVTTQHLWIAWGEGCNGKSTLLGVVQRIMGDYVGSAPESLLVATQRMEHPTELADLQGRRLVIAGETEASAKWRLQLMKRLSGDRTIKARRMHQDFFEFQRTHKTIVVTNHKPRVEEDSTAVWRRLRLIPFTVAIPEAERDERLLEKLWNEASGILNWLVAGCLAWRRDGLGEPKAVSDATQTYRQESDPLADWMAEHCIFQEEAWTATATLYSDYAAFVTERGGHPFSCRNFGERLGKRGISPVQKCGMGRGWKGIRLNARLSHYHRDADDVPPPI